MVACEGLLGFCITGLISAISALAWSLKQEIAIKRISRHLEEVSILDKAL